jgi:N-terminal domain of anti-restriction factor ArdC/Type IV secretory system Conjugative DNA transfer
MSKHTVRARAGQDRASLYDEITDKIIAELEAGRVPWVQPWGTAAARASLAIPKNASTDRQYSGVNILLLWGAAIERGFTGQSWLTFRQALSLGGHVRKGERGVRIAFSTNDERTAKRVSDALGTATETLTMKNYAGHRLSPWLGHLMVSRQETSRPLLTPGEVMQLSPNEAIVMVSGLHPLRARKVRYYEDPQLKSRILKPSCTDPVTAVARPDDWSGRTPSPPSAKLLAALKHKVRDPNGGIRREPELPQHEDVVVKAPLAENEFDAGPEEEDGDAE